MTTRCKVKCIETGQHADGTHRAKFAAVYDHDPNSENGKFFRYTPSLTLDVGIINDQKFEAGKEYYLEFSSADVID